MKLLSWQKRELETFKTHASRDFIVVAGTGTGKTAFGVACAAHTLSQHPNAIIVIATPSRSTKRSWKTWCSRMKLSSASKPQEIAADRSVFITTYAGAKNMLGSLNDYLGKRQIIAIFDEFHHMETNGEWTKAWYEIDDATYIKRIFLSGTPWHETGDLITWVSYKDTKDHEGNDVKVVDADVSYTYGQNVNSDDGDKNTVEVRFVPTRAIVTERVRNNETGEWEALTYDSESTTRSGSITPFVRFNTGELMTEKKEHIRSMIDEGIQCLINARKRLHKAGGIIFVSGKDEGLEVQNYMKGKGIEAMFVTSDDPQSMTAIKIFEESTYEWIIAIDMISEGTDIPRLKVAVDLSWKTTMLHIIQRWGRVLRLLRDRNHLPDEHNIEATVFFFNHMQLAYVASEIEKDLYKFKSDGKNGGGSDEVPQKRLRESVSGVGIRQSVVFKGEPVTVEIDALAQWIIDSNYCGYGASMDYRSAVWLAKVIIAENRVPDSFFNAMKDAEEVIPVQPSGEKTQEELWNDAKTAIKRGTSTVAKFFDGNYSKANVEFNIRMGVSTWSMKNKTLAEMRHRQAVVEAVVNNIGENYGD